MAIDPDGDGGGGAPRPGGYGGRSWTIDPAPDTLVFSTAPGDGVAIHVDEYDSSALEATDLWSIGAWSGAYGYPGEVEFHASRLWWARTIEQPQTLWASRIEGYYNFGLTVPAADDDGFGATLNSRTHNAIRDLVPLQNLVILSAGGAWKETTPQDAPITFETVSFRPQVAIPSSELPALLADSSALYVTAKGYQVRDLSYSFEADGYAGSDLTAFSSHLVKYRTLVDWDWQLVPYSAAFVVRNDGLLLSLVYKREHQVAGWTRHATPNGEFRSVVVLPEDGGDALYAIVRRTLGGVEVDCVERMAMPAEDVRDWMMVDCGLTYDGRNTDPLATVSLLATEGFEPDAELVINFAGDAAPALGASNVGDVLILGYDDPDTFARIRISEVTGTATARGFALSPIHAQWQTGSTADWAMAANTLSGLDHLNGETVQAIGDGQQMGDFVVVGGTITPEEPAAVVHVGFAYDCDLESLEVNVPGQETVQGKTKLIRQVDVNVQQGRNVRVGPSFDKLESQKPRARETWGREPDAITGLLDYFVSATWSTTGKVCVRAGGGLPATILSLSPHVGIGQ